MVVIVFTVGAAVKPAANSLPENTKEPEPTPPTTAGICFQRMTRICEKTGKTAITSMCPVISIIAVNAERFWIWTNGSEKKNQRQQVKN